MRNESLKELSCQLSPAKGHAISESNLHNLLLGQKCHRTEITSSIGGVRMFLYDNKVPDLPISLVDLLGFQNLQWGHDGKNWNSPSSLVIGCEPTPSKESIDTQDAIATIEIARQETFNMKNGNHELNNLHYRLTGTTQDGTIAGTEYDLRNENRLTGLSVSISRFEEMKVREELEGSGLSATEINRIIVAIPTDTNNPYTTSGLITKAMLSSVSRNPYPPGYTPIGGDFHTSVLNFRFNGEENNNAALEKAGYYCKENKDGTLTAGLKTEAAKERSLHSWRITVPTLLPTPKVQ